MTSAVDAPVAFSITEDGLAIDFTNTADWHAAEQPVEQLSDYSRLVAWGRAAGLLDDVGAAALLSVAAERQQAAALVLADAVALREALYHLFAAAGRGEPPPADDLSTLNERLPSALSRLRIDAPEERFPCVWSWSVQREDLSGFLAPVVWAAAELLMSPEIANVRECAGHPCGWIFLDHSRNHTRRWCSMAGCGNRAKARRHYERSKAQS